MTTITETNHLERIVLAFRGGEDGSFKGAHAERFNVVKRDGVEIVRQPGRATTITDLAATGFTWPEVVADLNTGLILAHEAQTAQIATLTAERDTALQERDAAQAALSTVQAELDALKTAPAPNVQVVSRLQARLALKGAGLLDAVEQAVAAASDDVKMVWADAQEFRRDSPTLLALAGALGLIDEQVDALFVAAAAIKA